MPNPHASLRVRHEPFARSNASMAALGALMALVAMLAWAPGVSLLRAQEAGFIEVTLRTCPPGYDVTASGADPEADCTLAGDGIQFTLRDDDPDTDERHADTGEREDGVVLFDDVASGQYVLTQDVPEEVAEVVIVSCDGFNTGPFYRMPLDHGPELKIPVPNNAPINCEWINILAEGATPQASPVAAPAATPDRAG